MKEITNKNLIVRFGILIQLPKNMKRSWENFKKYINRSGYYIILDLRKASKTCTPLEIKLDCCDTSLKIKRKKDFPLKDKKCKCGKGYLIKWI